LPTGLGRHSLAEIERLAARDLDAVATLLGDKPYLMENTPCGADATVFAFVAGMLCPHFETGIRTAAAAHGNLVAYRDRMMTNTLSRLDPGVFRNDHRWRLYDELRYWFGARMRLCILVQSKNWGRKHYLFVPRLYRWRESH
jgi:hypothetical protein